MDRFREPTLADEDEDGCCDRCGEAADVTTRIYDAFNRPTAVCDVCLADIEDGEKAS